MTSTDRFNKKGEMINKKIYIIPSPAGGGNKATSGHPVGNEQEVTKSTYVTYYIIVARLRTK